MYGCPSSREAVVLEEEVEARVAALVEARVQEVLASAAVQESLQHRLQQERAQLDKQVVEACIFDGFAFCNLVALG